MWYSGRSPGLFKKIEINRKYSCKSKTDSRQPIDKFRIYIASGNSISKIFDKRGRKIMFAEPFFYLPLPVSDRTIADTIPYTKQQPATSCYTNNGKMGFPGFGPYPAQQVKSDDE